MKTKSILAIVMAVAILATLALPLVASAAEMDEPPQIIINAPAGLVFNDATDFFQAFKIFDVTFSGDNYSYVIVPEFEAFDDYPDASSSYSLLDFLNDGPTAAEMTDLATALWTYIYYDGYDPNDIVRLVEPVGDIDVESAKVTIDLDVVGGGYGYYLVFHSASLFDDDEPFVQIVAACALTTTNPVAEITAKIDAPMLDKWIVLDDGSYVTVKGAGIGNTVDFALEITVPNNISDYDDYTLVVHDILGISSNTFLGLDTMSPYGFVLGLVVASWEKGNAISKNLLIQGDDYEFTPNANGFDIEIYHDTLLALPDGYDIIVTYTAIVNEGIKDTLKGSNSAWLEFSNNPYGDETGTTPPSTVKIYVTYLDNIIKVAGESAEITKGQEGFEKLPDADVMPTILGGTNARASFSPDGKYLAVPTMGSPGVMVYDITGSDPLKSADLVGAGMMGIATAYSPDGHFLAMTHLSPPYFSIFDVSAMSPVKMSDPDIPPSSMGYDIAFSPDSNFLAMVINTPPYMLVYDMTGTAPKKVDDPLAPPMGQGNGIAYSANGNILAVAHQNAPYLSLYDMTGNTPLLLPGPATLPTSDASDVKFSPDGNYLAVAHSAFPYITVYDVTVNPPVKIADPNIYPSSNAMGLAFSADSKYLVVSQIMMPYITVYDMISGEPVNTDMDYDILSVNGSRNVVFSGDGKYMAVTGGSTPPLAIYKAPIKDTIDYYNTSLVGAEFTLSKIYPRETPNEDGYFYDIGSPFIFTNDGHETLIYDGNFENEDLFFSLTSAPGIDVTGLGPGYYMLSEIAAPDGYNKLTYDVFFEITLEYDDDTEEWVYVKKVYFDTANTFLKKISPPKFSTIYDSMNGIFENIYIENYSGTLFPGTGGIGTAIFFLTSLLLTSALTAYTIATIRKRKAIPTA